MTYPSDYRPWVHVKSTLVGPGRDSSGLDHIYANERALVGYRTGRFPDGAVIVFDLLEVQEKGGNRIEGARLRVDVMMKDSARFAATGGWGFARFLKGDPAQRVSDTQAPTACFACHQNGKDRDFVFSRFRD